MIPVNICAIFRNETLYLKEWILFHDIVGVSKFYLYNNFSDDNYLEVLQPFIDRGLVELIEWPHPKPSQFAAYQDHISKHSGEKVWVSFTDCDEFLFSPKYDTVSEALSTFPDTWGALGVNWMCFGAGGQEYYSPEPVIERFTWRDHALNPVNNHIKSVIRMNQGVSTGPTPHHFNVGCGTFSEVGELLNSPFTSKHSSDILRLNHYSSKSRGEWLKRSENGKPDRADMIIDPAWYNNRQAMGVDDRDIQRFLPELKKRLNG